MNEFKTCNICKGFNGDELVIELKKLDPNATLVVGCQGMCAIGAKGPFVLVNGIPVIGSTNEEIIDKIKKVMIK